MNKYLALFTFVISLAWASPGEAKIRKFECKYDKSLKVKIVEKINVTVWYKREDELYLKVEVKKPKIGNIPPESVTIQGWATNRVFKQEDRLSATKWSLGNTSLSVSAGNLAKYNTATVEWENIKNSQALCTEK